MYSGEVDEIDNLNAGELANITVAEAIIIAQIKKALKGDTKAFEALLKAGVIDSKGVINNDMLIIEVEDNYKELPSLKEIITSKGENENE